MWLTLFYNDALFCSDDTLLYYGDSSLCCDDSSLSYEHGGSAVG